MSKQMTERQIYKPYSKHFFTLIKCCYLCIMHYNIIYWFQAASPEFINVSNLISKGYFLHKLHCCIRTFPMYIWPKCLPLLIYFERLWWRGLQHFQSWCWLCDVTLGYCNHCHHCQFCWAIQLDPVTHLMVYHVP